MAAGRARELIAQFERMTPDAIDVDVIELIHGGRALGDVEQAQDSYVTLARKASDGTWENLGAVKPTRLREYLPQMLPYLLQDSFFTVNAMHRAGRSLMPTGLPYGLQEEKHLRYLNVAYADLDFYRSEPPITWPVAVGVIAQLQEDGTLPPASIVGRSGRGAYLLWLLRSERPGTRQRAFPHEIALYKQVHKRLWHVLDKRAPELAADPIFDAARVLRTPGSENTKARERVQYIVQATERGLCPVYTLNELAEHFRLKPHIEDNQALYPRPIVNRGSAPLRRNGRLATGQYRLQDMAALEQTMGGFKQGTRSRSLWYFANFAKAAGWTYRQILTGAQEYAARCSPPYPSEDNDEPVPSIVARVVEDRGRIFSGATLAKWFNVSDAQAEDMGLRSIVPTETRQRRALAPSPQESKRDALHAAIRAIVDAHPGDVPSGPQLRAKLAAQGLDAPLRSVQRAVRELYPDMPAR